MKYEVHRVNPFSEEPRHLIGMANSKEEANAIIAFDKLSMEATYETMVFGYLGYTISWNPKSGPAPSSESEQ